jgi:hypothetical protein
MDNIIRSVYDYDLSGVDVEKITRGKAEVRLYKDLLKFNSILEAIGKHGMMLLLFPVSSDTSGHWISVIYHPETKTIEHFDSYGLSWKQEMGYTNNQFVKKNLLGDLYGKAIGEGYRVVCNPYRFQKMETGRNDCGRHAAIRCRFHYLTIHEYAAVFLKQKMSPDWLITCLTFLSLREDEKEEESIIRAFKNKN